MKQKNIFTTFLISIATVCMVLGYHVLSEKNFFNTLKAEDNYYTMGIVEGAFEPYTTYGDYSGIMSDHYNEFFYLSHTPALVEQRKLYLTAKDDNTPAVFCNQTVINGIISVEVVFEGGPLYLIVTSSFFERYEYTEDDLVVSGIEKTFSGTDLGYLLILSPDPNVTVKLTDVIVKYRCEHDTDNDFFYAPGLNRYTGARSWGANRKMKHDYIEFTTDPKPYNNNYSVGKTDPKQDYVDSWYRWNGVSVRNHYLDDGVKKYDGLPFGTFSSNNFEIICSVIVEPRVFYDENAWFCVAPWVQLDNEDHSEELLYMQSYIGNDNYDPLGGIHTDYTDTYRGRFYTKYAAGGGGYAWGFVDPNDENIVDDTMTLREAYEATNLPFFQVRFEVIENSYSVYINGFKIHHVDEAFYDDEEYDDQLHSINTICLHGVNYGLKDGTAGDAESEYDPYRLTYLNPIVREIA